jgi:hypothetical protein
MLLAGCADALGKRLVEVEVRVCSVEKCLHTPRVRVTLSPSRLSRCSGRHRKGDDDGVTGNRRLSRINPG